VDVDATVKIGDLAAVLPEFEMIGPVCASDLDHDLDVDLADVGVLPANFGSTCG